MSPSTDPSPPAHTVAQQKAIVAERRRKLVALVRPDEPISFARRCELARQLGTSSTTVFRDLEALRSAGQPARRVAVQLYTPAPSIAERDATLLRVLGHLRLLRADWIADLLYPERPAAAVARHLDSLRARGLIWVSKQRVAPRATGRGRRVAPPPNLPAMYGLTPVGKEHLRQVGQLPEPHHISALHAQALRTRPLPPEQLQHDLQHASWCAAMLAAARRCTLLNAAFAQVTPALLVRYQHDRRIVDLEADALVLLRFRREPSRQPGDPLPWFMESFAQLAQPENAVVAFTLHIDAGWTDAEITALSAQYRRIYHDPLRTPNVIDPERRVLPLPIVLTTRPDRVRAIASAWNSAWETISPAVAGGEPLRGVLPSVGMVTCPPQAEHPVWGALWGWHWQLNDFRTSSVPGPRHLLGRMFETPEVWESWCRATPAR